MTHHQAPDLAGLELEPKLADDALPPGQGSLSPQPPGRVRQKGSMFREPYILDEILVVFVHFKQSLSFRIQVNTG